MANPNDIGSRECVGLAHALTIYKRAIHAEVQKQVAVRLAPDLRVVAGNLIARYHDVRSCIASKGQCAGPYSVLASIGEADQPSPRLRPGTFRIRLRDQVGKRAGVEELGAARPGRVHYQKLP